MIYILTGKIHSGKTTALQKWIATRKDVDGLLCPDDMNGKRYFFKIRSREEIELEVETEFDSEASKEEIIDVGNFRFLKSTFNDANAFLISIASETENNYLILDEIGKLELRNEGLHISAEKLVPFYNSNKNKHLIFVVRESLIESVLKKYSISEYTILTKKNLSSFD